MKYLRDRAEYENRYDRLVISICRDVEKRIHPIGDALTSNMDDIKKKYQDEKKGKVRKETKKEAKRSSLIAQHFIGGIYLYYRRVRLEEGREESISKWMREDRERDEFFEKTNITTTQYCHQCSIPMDFRDKTLMYGIGKKEKDRILFFYQCPRCKYRRAIYDNGDEYEPLEYICEKCVSRNVKTSMKERKNGDFLFQETCSDCGHIKKDIHKRFKEKPIDPNYETDRRRFCMTAREVADWHMWLQNAEEVLGRREDRENSDVKL